MIKTVRRAPLLLLLAACATPQTEPGFRPRAIILHRTDLAPEEAVRRMREMKRSVHYVVRPDGSRLRPLPPTGPGRAARGMDDASLHVLSCGDVAATARLVRELSDAFDIPRTNEDVVGRMGIFSHMQTKYRFGGYARGERKGSMEPGEEFTRAVIEAAGGTYFAERNWKDRTADGWMQVFETASKNRKRGALTKGRGLTPAPVPPVPSLTILEAFRLRTVDRGPMKEIRGIVLHFTVSPTYAAARRTLESRRLSPHIMVDLDGTAYQVMDALTDQPAAAGGTNAWCIQIEIVGVNEKALQANVLQARGVARVIDQLCSTYDIPRTNYDIGSRRGIFSHGQAKKRFGRSAWLWGTDFDPGEAYMKQIIEAVGGIYTSEPGWKDRDSDDWVISQHEWLP